MTLLLVFKDSSDAMLFCVIAATKTIFCCCFTDTTVRERSGTVGVRGRSPLSRGRLQLLDTVRTASRRLSRVQLSAVAHGRRHRRAAHHRRRVARTAAQNVVPARPATNAARAFSHARQHKR